MIVRAKINRRLSGKMKGVLVLFALIVAPLSLLGSQSGSTDKSEATSDEKVISSDKDKPAFSNDNSQSAKTRQVEPYDSTSNEATAAPPIPSPALDSPADEVVSKVRPLRSAKSKVGNESLAVYFAYGPVTGGSILVQANWDGTVRSYIDLPYSLSDLAADDGRLLATIGSASVGQGRVIAISESGETKTVFRDKKLLPDTIAIWSSSDSNEYLVADNGADVVVAVSKDNSRPAKVKIRITGHPDFQTMSVARCIDGSVLYSGSDVNGVFRLPADTGPKLGKPLLSGRAAVAARPGSTTWVAALRTRLHVFEGDRPVTELAYPEGKIMFRPNIAFAQDGILVLGFHGRNREYFYAVDLDRKEFTRLFTVDVRRLTGLAVAQKMEWTAGDAVHFKPVK